MYDIVVIGSGPAGYVAGIRGAQLGKKVCIIEKAKLGGVCLNCGCIPTKSLIADVSILKNIADGGRVGINVEPPMVDFTKVISHKENIVKRLAYGIHFLLKHNGVEVLKGIGSTKEPGCIKIGTKEIITNSIILCSGSSPFVPFVIDHEYILTSDEALNLSSIPNSLVIIGGGAVGVEFATIFSGFKAKVTLVEMLPSILPEIKDSKIAEIIRNSLMSQGIEVIEGTRVEEISVVNGHTYSLLSNGDKISADKVIVACGRVPNSEEHEALELKMENKVIVVNERMQTNIPGIYAAGDVTGPPLLAHKASAEGIVAAENIGMEPKLAPIMDYEAIPCCIFSTPEVAWVGKFECEVPDARVGEYGFIGVGKALCIGESTGFVKVVADKECKIKGVQIVGPHASELIPIGILGVKNRLHADELGNLIYPHPTLSECIKEAFLDVTHSAIHKG